MSNTTMKIPVSATYRLIDGEMVRIAVEYAECTPEQFARFLLDKFGADTVFKGVKD